MEIKRESKVGRPRKFATPEQMQDAIDVYFDRCDNRIKKVYVKSQQEIVDFPSPIPYSIEGLCATLEIDRLTLLNYEKLEGYEEFFNTVKKAKAKILQNMVERSLEGDNNPATTIFLLKNNNGYVDKIETQNNTTVTSANFTLSKLNTTKQDFASNESDIH